MKYLFTVLASFVLFAPDACYAQAASGAGQTIAIIDTGVVTTDPNRARVIDQFCWSRATENTFGMFTPGSRHYDIFSMCSNGNSFDFVSNNAAQVPIITHHNSCAGCYPNHVFGTDHGSRVLGEAVNVAPAASYLVINNSHYNSAGVGRTAAGGFANCGHHGPNNTANSIPNEQQPSGDLGCYSASGAEREANVINAILNRPNIAAINLSSSSSLSCNSNNDIFRAIKDQEIAFVTSAGNGGRQGVVGFPACNPNVISVGALYSSLRYAPVTSAIGKIDFFAEGVNQSNVATSWAAPIVSGAFALMQSARTQRETLEDMKHALKVSAGNSCINHRGQCVPIVTIQTAIAAAECLKQGTCRDNSPPGDDSIGFEDNGQYGPIYGDNSTDFEIDIDFEDLLTRTTLNSITGVQSKFISVPAQRDIVLSFKTKMTNVSSGNGIRVFVNNILRENTEFHRGEKEFEYVLNRNFFQSGNNVIRLDPRSSSNLLPWGVSEITAELNPIVPLTIGATDTNIYGYLEAPARLTSLRASFNLDNISTDMKLSATGWDIDIDNETQVFVNGKSYGFLSEGTSNNAYSARDTFILRKEGLIIGDNLIEFVQRQPASGWAGIQDEKWAVKDLRIDAANFGFVVPSINLLLDD